MELSERQFVEQLAEEAGKKGLSAQCVQQLPHLVGWLGKKRACFSTEVTRFVIFALRTSAPQRIVGRPQTRNTNVCHVLSIFLSASDQLFRIHLLSV